MTTQATGLQAKATMAGLTIGGTIVGILLKIMSNMEIEGVRFKHPYFITMFFFLGQSLSLVLYKLDPTKKVTEAKAAADGLRVDTSPFLFLIPALLDALRNLLFIIGVMFVPASVSNMMGALLVVVTTLLVSNFIPPLTAFPALESTIFNFITIDVANFSM